MTRRILDKKRGRQPYKMTPAQRQERSDRAKREWAERKAKRESAGRIICAS